MYLLKYLVEVHFLDSNARHWNIASEVFGCGIFLKITKRKKARNPNKVRNPKKKTCAS